MWALIVVGIIVALLFLIAVGVLVVITGLAIGHAIRQAVDVD